MTTPYRKPFSKEMYDLFDASIKDSLINLLVKNGHTILDSSESYGADVISSKDGVIFFSEGEMKSSWKDFWPKDWKEIRIPERKIKLIEKHGNVDFYIFNKYMSKCWKINSSLMTSNTIREVEGRRIAKGEHFFNIPYEKAELILLKEDDFGF